MKRYLKIINQLVDFFDDVRFEQIPRENNSAIDEVTKLASTEDTIEKLGLKGVHGSGWVELRGFFYLTHHVGLKKIQPNPTYHISLTQPT